jgi:F-type H+-transporting ATPase subunit b
MHETSFFANPRTWVGVAFVIFVALVGRRLWAAFAGMLDARAEVVRVELAEAKRLREEAERLLQEAERERASAEQEARAMLERSRAEAERLARDARQEAERAAQRREAAALDRIAAAERAAVAEVRSLAAELAVETARTVIGERLDAEADAPLIDHAIASLPRALRAA